MFFHAAYCALLFFNCEHWLGSIFFKLHKKTNGFDNKNTTCTMHLVYHKTQTKFLRKLYFPVVKNYLGYNLDDIPVEEVEQGIFKNDNKTLKALQYIPRVVCIFSEMIIIQSREERDHALVYC